MINIFIVDDHALVIEGIFSILQNENGMKLVGHATNGNNCKQFFKTNTADIILMDISLPDINGIDLCKDIKKMYPGIAVIALSTFDQGSYIQKMMDAGASGYILKNANKHEILDAITTVYAGKLYLSFNATKALKQNHEDENKLPHLTKREKEILQLLAEGLTNLQITEKLFISIDTVDSHRKNLYTKLNVKNTAMLIRYAIENKLV